MAFKRGLPMLLGAALLLLQVCVPAHAFIGIIGGKGRGACEGEGGLCFTQDACCDDFTCEKASQATYGRCVSNKAQLQSSGPARGVSGNGDGAVEEDRHCSSDADCPSGRCCAQEAAGFRGLGARRVCRLAGEAGGAACAGQSAENLFQQYYSGLFRKRGAARP